MPDGQARCRLLGNIQQANLGQRFPRYFTCCRNTFFVPQAPHQHVVQNGKLFEKLGDLKGSAEPAIGNLVWLPASYVLVVEENPSLCWRQKTCNEVEQRRFACTVGTDYGDKLV